MKENRLNIDSPIKIEGIDFTTSPLLTLKYYNTLLRTLLLEIDKTDTLTISDINTLIKQNKIFVQRIYNPIADVTQEEFLLQFEKNKLVIETKKHLLTKRK